MEREGPQTQMSGSAAAHGVCGGGSGGENEGR